MSCKDCSRGGMAGVAATSRISDVRSLYSPPYFKSYVKNQDKSRSSGCRNISCSETKGRCEQVCQQSPCCEDQFKSYWFRNCEVPIIRRYEEQPWFRNRIVQGEWREFVDNLVTPYNIGCKLCPGPDDWQFRCHKARSMIGPTVECVWDLPEQEPW